MRRKPSALEKQVAKKPTVKLDPLPETETEDDPAEHVTEIIIKRARNLAVIYTAMKKDVQGVEWARLRTEGTRHFASFIKTARLLLHYELTSGRWVSDTDYVLAHLWYWGKDCFTTRLYSSSSIALYDAYMRIVSAEKIGPDELLDTQYSDQLVAYLSSLRRESPTAIVRSLKDSGLL